MISDAASLSLFIPDLHCAGGWMTSSAPVLSALFIPDLYKRSDDLFSFYLWPLSCRRPYDLC